MVLEEDNREEVVLMYNSIVDIDISTISKRFREIVSEIDSILGEREKLRDKLIKMGRDIVRLSGWAINALHRGEVREAEKYLNEIEEYAREFIELASRDPSLLLSGYSSNILSEYVEAKLFYELIVRGRILSYRDLRVPEIPYLQGVGDTLGEIRRLVLDLLRGGDLEKAEKLLEVMEALYYELRALEYPEALLPGVKHKVDVARRLIDDTKSLLLTIKARKS